MPTVSKKQEKFMQAVAHNPAFAKKAGVPQSVGKEFTKSGGGMPVKPIEESKSRSRESDEAKRSAVSREEYPALKMPKTPTPASMKKGGKVKKMAGGGMTSMGKVKTAAPSRDGVAVKGKTKGKMVTMAGGKGMKYGGKC
jgi:hypothetical protein